MWRPAKFCLCWELCSGFCWTLLPILLDCLFSLILYPMLYYSKLYHVGQLFCSLRQSGPYFYVGMPRPICRLIPKGYRPSAADRSESPKKTSALQRKGVIDKIVYIFLPKQLNSNKTVSSSSHIIINGLLTKHTRKTNPGHHTGTLQWQRQILSRLPWLGNIFTSWLEFRLDTLVHLFSLVQIWTAV